MSSLTLSLACSTKPNVTLAFGGQAWAIDSADMNLGAVNSAGTYCLGGIFVLSEGSNVPSGSNSLTWVVGDTFLKNVYSVFRQTPAAVGFAALSTNAGGTGRGASRLPCVQRRVT